MRVLYDISVLGMGHRLPKARTGVFRVIENLADQLVRRHDCQINFSSDFDIDTINACLEYLAANPSFSSIPFQLPKFFNDKVAAKKRWNELVEKVEAKDLSVSQKLPLKVKIRATDLKNRIIGKLHSHQYFTNSYYGQGDIYHSTFFPIPTNVNSRKQKVFLTSYDIIPLLHPQYAEQDIIQLIGNVVESITPDTWVLCISKATRNDLLNYLGPQIDPAKVKVTELAASDIFYESRDKEFNKTIREKYRIPDAPYVLSLCTLEPRKNIDQAIRAFVQLCKQERINDLYLVLVGTKGWMFDKIFEELESSEDIKSRIIITGFVDDSDLAAIYSDATMFVYPSFYEGFGLPPLEAMKCGVPVITSDNSSLPEVVGDAGMMVNATDLAALSSAMLNIYKSDTLQQQMRTKSLQRAERFSWARCANETAGAYKLSLGL